MRKHLWSKLSVILIIMYFVSPVCGRAWGDERELESYAPWTLRFHLLIPRVVDIRGTFSRAGDGKIHVVVNRDFDRIREESFIEPTDEEWKEFFNVVERANIWGLGEEEEFAPEGMSFGSSTGAIFWRLILVYCPDRILDLEGLETIVDASINVRGGNRLSSSGRKRATISRNLLIANEFENIHRIFFAIQKLLGEDFSGYDFNLICFSWR